MKIGILLATAMVALPFGLRAIAAQNGACAASTGCCAAVASAKQCDAKASASACATKKANCPHQATSSQCKAGQGKCRGKCQDKDKEKCKDKAACQQACAAQRAQCKKAVQQACNANQAGQAAVPAGSMKAIYQVEGMSCAACEKKLAQALNQIEGVREASACAQTKVAKVIFDPKRVKDADLAAAIERAGYKVKGETLVVAVKGMSCAACEKKVSNALASLKSVKVRKVCHKSNQAIVTFDPKQISGDRVVAAISETGFTVVR